MRDRTRGYTTDLPRIGMQFLANLRHCAGFTCQTESGTLYGFRLADGYDMIINDVKRIIRTDPTRAG